MRRDRVNTGRSGRSLALEHAGADPRTRRDEPPEVDPRVIQQAVAGLAYLSDTASTEEVRAGYNRLLRALKEAR